MESKVLGPMLRVSRLTDSRDADQKPWGGSSGKSSEGAIRHVVGQPLSQDPRF